MNLPANCLVSLVVLSATAALEVLGVIPRSSKLLLGFSMKFSVLGVRICARFMTIGLPPITCDLKHTGELWVYIGTLLSNPSGNTGRGGIFILFI